MWDCTQCWAVCLAGQAPLQTSLAPKCASQHHTAQLNTAQHRCCSTHVHSWPLPCGSIRTRGQSPHHFYSLPAPALLHSPRSSRAPPPAGKRTRGWTSRREERTRQREAHACIALVRGKGGSEKGGRKGRRGKGVRVGRWVEDSNYRQQTTLDV